MKSPKEDLYRTAAYIRLSKEDGDKEESDSVFNQKALLNRIIEESEDLFFAGDYIDDGYSGTNFDRPAFRRLERDIKRGKIDCVIVKDLSRLGRNYIEAGRYLEEFFPDYGIRFISVNDHIDSQKDPNTAEGLLVPFKNLLNDEYSKDVSRKVRSVLDAKRKNGEFIGSFAPYGYQKSLENKNHLVVEEKTAAVVREIFSLFLSGHTVLGITKLLNQRGEEPPSARRGKKGGSWHESTVRRILKNRLYLGDMVQGKRKVKSYKRKTLTEVGEENWIVVEGTHQPIIDREDFLSVQRLFQKERKAPDGQQTVSLFSGLLQCGDCKSSMHKKRVRQPYGEYVYYICGGFKRKTGCSKHSIREDKLYKAVLAAINHQIALAESLESVFSAADQAFQRKLEQQNLEREKGLLEKEIRKLSSLIDALYPDWKAGDITKEESRRYKGDYEQKKNEAQSRLAQIEEEAKNTPENPFLETFRQTERLSALNRAVLDRLVEKIYVYEGGKIVIRFRFYRQRDELLKRLRGEDLEKKK